MSHFTVLVIGDDPEGQLAPYSECIEVGPYVREDVSILDQKRFQEYYSKKHPEDSELPFAAMYAKYGYAWNGASWKCNSDGVWQDWSTYNPQSKWDWYSLGGRWMGYFKMKEGVDGKVGEPGAFDNTSTPGWADQARKGDIDFVGMRQDYVTKRLEKYDAFHTFLGDCTFPDWDAIMAKYPDDIDKARAEYQSIPIIKEIDKHEDLRWLEWSEIKMLLLPREQYAELMAKKAIRTFAVVMGGKWYEHGQMGWWGIVTDEISENDWTNEFYKLLNSVPDDTLLSLYDCHI